MNTTKTLQFILICVLCFACSKTEPDSTPDNAILQPHPFHKVRLTDNFWAPRLETQRATLIPFALEKTQPAVENLKKTANFLKGIPDELPFPHRYISSDLFKVMEGVAYLLMDNRSPAIEMQMDSIINIIADAQQDDGYLYVAHITGVSKDHDHWGGGGMGDQPYSFVVHSHELYNMGHMYEAAIAYFQATGKDKWLKVAEKNAAHINQVFFEGDPNYNNGKAVMQAPGHQELELALVKLYRLTGKELYLKMARKFLDIRGITYAPDGDKYLKPTYAQQHLPVNDQKEAVGHAVRAAYMYAAMADVDALSGDTLYTEALENIWHDIVDRKLHLTGGIGAMHGIEGFGPAYELPNAEAYNETCAAVANVFWNYRMFLRHKEGRFMDVAEIALLNNALAGVNLEGNRFFYVNPLEADGVHPFNHGNAGRSPWFNTACCPSNIARLIPQVSGMLYAYTNQEIYVNFYASNNTEIPLENGMVQLIQESNYPFDGAVNITVQPRQQQKFTLKLRIPGWLEAQFVPGELYHYKNKTENTFQLSLNNEMIEVTPEKGFVAITRNWQPGDKIRLTLPMPIRFNDCNEQVAANLNKLAVTRGPLVYCAESIDNTQDFMNTTLSKK